VSRNSCCVCSLLEEEQVVEGLGIQGFCPHADGLHELILYIPFRPTNKIQNHYIEMSIILSVCGCFRIRSVL
jgi:hypothetical protein